MGLQRLATVCHLSTHSSSEQRTHRSTIKRTVHSLRPTPVVNERRPTAIPRTRTFTSKKILAAAAMQVDAAVHESDEMFDGLWKAGILSRDDWN